MASALRVAARSMSNSAGATITLEKAAMEAKSNGRHTKSFGFSIDQGFMAQVTAVVHQRQIRCAVSTGSDFVDEASLFGRLGW
jgi:hypothetical protein